MSYVRRSLREASLLPQTTGLAIGRMGGKMDSEYGAGLEIGAGWSDLWVSGRPWNWNVLWRCALSFGRGEVWC
jgi:hypothetical protein